MRTSALHSRLPHTTGHQGDIVLAALLLFSMMIIAGGMVLGMQHVHIGWMLMTLGALLFCLLVYSAFIEPRTLRVRHFKVPFSLRGMRIVVAADFHVGPFKGRDWVEKVVQKINSLKPDLILLPGDFLFDEHADIQDLLPLQALSAPLGIFAVSGNHDTGHHLSRGVPFRQKDRTPELQTLFTALKIPLLRNTSHLTHFQEQVFAIAGVDDYWCESYDIDQAFKDIHPDMPVLLLTHNPDNILDAKSKRAQLIVSGHTHGGQVCIPGFGALSIPTELGRAFANGLFPLAKNRYLFITRGVSETLLRLRFFCPPEIALLETK